MTDWQMSWGFNDGSVTGGFSQRGFDRERQEVSHEGVGGIIIVTIIIVIDMHWMLPMLHARQCS